MDPIITEINAVMQQAGCEPYVLENRDGHIYVQHIIGGDQEMGYVYDWALVGPADEVLHKMKHLFPAEPPTPGHCPICGWYSGNLRSHECRHCFLAEAEDAYRQRDREKVAQIVATAREKGFDIMQKRYEKTIAD